MISSIPLMARFPFLYRKDERNFYGAIEMEQDLANRFLQGCNVTLKPPKYFEPLEGELVLAIVGHELDSLELTLEVITTDDEFITLTSVAYDIDNYFTFVDLGKKGLTQMNENVFLTGGLSPRYRFKVNSINPWLSKATDKYCFVTKEHAMKLNERRRAARNAIALLEKAGCEVLGFNINHERPVIYINFPSERLIQAAIELSERINGTTKETYLSRFNGCIVRWGC